MTRALVRFAVAPFLGTAFAIAATDAPVARPITALRLIAPPFGSLVSSVMQFPDEDLRMLQDLWASLRTNPSSRDSHSTRCRNPGVIGSPVATNLRGRSVALQISE